MYSSWDSAAQRSERHPTRTPTDASPAGFKRPRLCENGRRVAKATRACDSCKIKKARCSGLKPCAACTERKLECTYQSQYLRGRPPTPPASNPNPGSCDAASLHPPPETGTGPPIEDSEGPCRGSPELDTEDEINGQYVDRTSGLSFLQRAQLRFNQDQRKQRDGTEQVASTADKPLLGFALGTQSAVDQSLWPIVPDRTRATELLDLYFDICVATYKPLHRPTVDQWYGVVSENLAFGLPLTHGLSNAKVATLLTVFAVANFHHQKSLGILDDTTSLTESDSFLRHSRVLTDAETEIPQLESAQARLLQVFYLLATCRMNQAWYIFGNLLQIVSALGMHRRNRRKVSPLPGTSAYIQTQCRIRTFWCTYILDRNLGVLFGRPRHFHDKDIDQDCPDRIEDDDEGYNAETGNGDCHLDGLLWNIKLARLLGEVSDGLYAIRPSPVTSRIELARTLEARLQGWQNSLPPLLKAKPSSLARGFRRQNVALRFAYEHAVMHIYRPFLLGRTTETMEAFRQESARRCVGAAREVMRLVDSLAKEGRIFHAYWWTHYIVFCALTVSHVCILQHVDVLSEAKERERLLALVNRCQLHLAQATATNSPTRRYSIIVEDLRGTTDLHQGRTGMPTPGGVTVDPANAAGIMNESTIASLDALAATSGEMISVDGTSDRAYDPFMDWQSSDWLDLDASAYWEFFDLGHDLT